MGKGLSPLQRDILDALRDFPSIDPSAFETTRYIGDWARPSDIMAALDKEPTNANRATISKALNRLVERELVAKAYGQLRSQGSGARYAARRS